MKASKYIIDKTNDCNPANSDPAENRDWTPLHSSARFCYVELCGLIINNVSNKNPAADNGQTPHGHVEVRKTLLEDGRSPLRTASKNGHVEVC